MSTPQPKQATQVDDLAGLDCTAPCEYSLHDKYGTGPATWAILERDSRPCGCPGKGWRLHCNGCLQTVKRVPLYCTECLDGPYRFADFIAGIETI